jgi:hypothetical protein
MAWLPKVKTSPRKLNLVAKLVRRMGLEQALMQLRFCSKKMADVVSKTIHDAKWNAVNNNVHPVACAPCMLHAPFDVLTLRSQGWDASRLYIDEAIVGKNKYVAPKLLSPFFSCFVARGIVSTAEPLRSGTSKASAITAEGALVA